MSQPNVPLLTGESIVPIEPLGAVTNQVVAVEGLLLDRANNALRLAGHPEAGEQTTKAPDNPVTVIKHANGDVEVDTQELTWLTFDGGQRDVRGGMRSVRFSPKTRQARIFATGWDATNGRQLMVEVDMTPNLAEPGKSFYEVTEIERKPSDSRWVNFGRGVLDAVRRTTGRQLVKDDVVTQQVGAEAAETGRLYMVQALGDLPPIGETNANVRATKANRAQSVLKWLGVINRI